MSELTVEQVEWFSDYLINLAKPGSEGDDVYRYDTKAYDLAHALIADWHRQREEIEQLRTHHEWLDSWIKSYEQDGPADGKAQAFWDYYCSAPSCE
ncbi:hypothetical protein LCGC14_1742250 [marine sediment metagenome]|uniref:Uncharacterized protein n=1 Tax=marine sediment metagenome TaxID=412755 RepID=A0A0F9JLK0_9ZZZZ